MFGTRVCGQTLLFIVIANCASILEVAAFLARPVCLVVQLQSCAAWYNVAPLVNAWGSGQVMCDVCGQ